MERVVLPVSIKEIRDIYNFNISIISTLIPETMLEDRFDLI
jgi:hypothetical protein